MVLTTQREHAVCIQLCATQGQHFNGVPFEHPEGACHVHTAVCYSEEALQGGLLADKSETYLATYICICT